MSRRPVLLLVLALVSVATTAAQAPRGSNAYAPPRTPWGDPDIQGVYNVATITPFERPATLAGREFHTEQEVAQLEGQAAGRRVDQPPREGDTGTYNQFWFDGGTRVVATRRTSLVIDPPDGRIPALTENAQRLIAERNAARRGRALDGPEHRPNTERCLWWASTGPPVIPTGYGNNYRIAQGPGYVMVLAEMIHDARIIPLDGRPHVPPTVRQWLGDARGRWEGNTLVVETKNFNDETSGDFGRPPFGSVRGLGRNARLIERFTRIAKDTLIYEFTVDDLETYTRRWTAQMSWAVTDQPVYEYACHEGNYGMENILNGARQEEKRGER